MPIIYGRKTVRFAFAVFLILTVGSSLIIGLGPSLLQSNSNHDSARSPIMAGPSKPAVLGFDCGLGSRQATLNGTSFPVAPSENGQFETLPVCTWIGDIAQSGLNTPNGTSDRSIEPLVTDQDEAYNLVSPKIGGGFTANIVVLQNGTFSSTINSFDLTVSWNPSILRAVLVDQTGLFWSTQGVFTVVPPAIDNVAGSLRLAQLITTSPTGVNLTLFRIRYDVVGVGTSALTVGTTPGAPCGLCNLVAVTYVAASGSFDTETFYDPSHNIGWSASWAFSPRPLVPGSPTTFTATATCTGCTGALIYRWDVNNDGIPEAATNPATLTIPNPSLLGTRVNLTISDAATPLQHNVTLIQRLPLTPIIRGPSTLALNTGGTWNATWLGGIPSYTGSWRFCPGNGITANAVCAKPNPPVALTPSQTALQTVNATTGQLGAYHFAGAYNVSVTITDSGSPALPSPNTSTSYFVVNVTGIPQVYTVTASTNSASNATAGRAITFTSTISYNSAYPNGFRSNSFNYRFIFGDGTVGTLTGVFGFTASITHVYLAAGNYNILVVPQEAGGPSLSKIQETGTIALSVATPVSGDFSFNPTPPLSGQSTSFTTSISGGVGPYTLTWNLGDGSTTTGASPSHVYLSSGSYTVVLNATDSAGRLLTKSHTIGVAPGPVSGTLSIAPTAPSVGQTLTFNATAIGGTAPYTYAWNFGDGSTGSAANPTHTYSAGGNYTVTVTITDAGGRSSILTRTITVASTSSPPPDYLLYGIIAAAAVVGGVLVYALRRRGRTRVTPP